MNNNSLKHFGELFFDESLNLNGYQIELFTKDEKKKNKNKNKPIRKITIVDVKKPEGQVNRFNNNLILKYIDENKSISSDNLEEINYPNEKLKWLIDFNRTNRTNRTNRKYHSLDSVYFKVLDTPKIDYESILKESEKLSKQWDTLKSVSVDKANDILEISGGRKSKKRHMKKRNKKSHKMRRSCNKLRKSRLRRNSKKTYRRHRH